jgi:hypothetical protein
LDNFYEKFTIPCRFGIPIDGLKASLSRDFNLVPQQGAKALVHNPSIFRNGKQKPLSLDPAPDGPLSWPLWTDRRLSGCAQVMRGVDRVRSRSRRCLMIRRPSRPIRGCS